MLQKVTVFIASIFVASLVMSSVCSAQQTITGVVKTFNAKTGTVVIQTASQKDATFSVSQTVVVFRKANGKDIQVAEAWQFLKDNLMNGTKVQLKQLAGTVVTIWILGVPQ
jgi:hypothetical protein